MNAVLDTNVVAHFILGTEPFARDAKRAIDEIGDAWAPAFWEAELANAVWIAVRHGVLTVAEAGRRLALADALGIHSVATRALWQGALVRAHQSGVAVYDTLFVELAVRERLPLVTGDARVLAAFPDVAIDPSAAVRRARDFRR